MFLANPAGLWALLGIPAVLAIHFLQRKAKTLPVTTLFLLEKTQRESASGRRFDRLMNSVPLWMQLLAVALLAWILAEPRYQRPRSTQRVAVVLDSSASMAVFKQTLSETLAEELPALQGPAAELELTLLESVPGRDRLYGGGSVDEAVTALADWNPGDGVSDPTAALRIARSLVGREGIVVYATDTPDEKLPFDTRLLAVGEPIDNAGFTGMSFTREQGADVWHATIRNYSKNRSSRTWQVEYPDGTATEPKALELDPGAIIAIQAALPKSHDRARIVLSADRFAADDTLPIVRPAPKTIGLFTATSPEFSQLAERMKSSLEAIEPVNDASTADLALVSYDPLDPVLPDGNAVVFVNDETRPGAYLKGGIVTEDHPLVTALNWQPLLVRESIQLERLATDDVLLWQDTRPLIFLRETPSESGPPTRQLCFNFDLRKSNVATLPAFIVCLHRFVEDLRARKIAGYSDNLETGQPVRLRARAEVPVTLAATDPTGGETTTRPLGAGPGVRFDAPLKPGFVRVEQGDDVLLNAAVHFADTREADFTDCATEDHLAEGSASAIDRHTHEDHWWRAWVLLLLAALIVAWHYSRDRRAEPAPSPANA